MGATDVVGWTLVAGLVLFLVGAGAWRLAYEQPLEQALRTIHEDRRRRAWIHGWMIPGVTLTAAGQLALVTVVTDPAGRAWVLVAAAVWGLGGVCWVASLVARLTVVPRAAAALVATDEVPAWFPPVDAWASGLYVVHMTSAYLAAVLLGAGLLADGTLVADWLGWSCVGFGVLWLVGFTATRAAGPFNPPFWVHCATGAVGVALLL